MDGAFISPSNPLNVAAFPPRLVHLHCLQVGPKVSPTPLEGMCRVWLVLTCGQMLQISSRPSYKSVWGEVYVNWLLLGKREFTFLSCCQWTYRWCFFQTVYLFFTFYSEYRDTLLSCSLTFEKGFLNFLLCHRGRHRQHVWHALKTSRNCP